MTLRFIRASIIFEANSPLDGGFVFDLLEVGVALLVQLDLVDSMINDLFQYPKNRPGNEKHHFGAFGHSFWIQPVLAHLTVL